VLRAKAYASTSVTGAVFRFESDVGRWLTLAEALPKTLTKPIGERAGSGMIAARSTVPDSAQTGQYTVPVALDIEAVGGRGTTNSYVTFTVTRLTSPIPDYMTYVFAVLFVAIVLTAYLKR
jgi:hypothetical protein